MMYSLPLTKSQNLRSGWENKKKQKMKKLSLSLKIYFGFIIILLILASVYIFLPQGSFLPVTPEQLPASKGVIAIVNGITVLFLYGGLGLIGLYLSGKIGFAEIWSLDISNRQRFVIPALVGISVGIFFIFSDAIISHFHEFGPLPHPPFPASIIASATAGIGEEVIFRLFFISFWVWLISNVILKKKYHDQVFWIVAVLSALAFAIGHAPSIMILLHLNNIKDIPAVIMIEIILLNSVLSLFAAYYFRKYGFIAAVGIHFWTDVIWHVIWGII